MNFLLFSTGLFSRALKTIILITLTAFIPFSAWSQSALLKKRINIQVTNISIAQTLEEIETKAACSFIYSPDLLDVNRKISLSQQNATVESILQHIFGEGIRRIEVKGNQISLQPSKGKGTIRGKVLTSDGLPAAYVNVDIESRKVQADENGDFTFSNVEVGTYKVTARYVGLKAQEQVVTVLQNETAKLSFTLYEDMNALQEVVVNGERVNRFANKTTAYVSRLPLTNLENPQVYSVVTKQLMQEQVSVTVADAIRNAGGAVSVINPSGGVSAYFRGFGTGINARNGMESTSDRSAVDLANIERIEVMKGPSGTLFGASVSSFGGVVNVVTKKPIEAKRTELSYTTGSFGLNRLTVDINTPLDREKKVLFRVNGASNRERSFLDYGFNNTFLLAPSISYHVNEKLTLNLDAELLQVHNTQPMNHVFRSADIKQPADLLLGYRKTLFHDNVDVKNYATRVFAEAVYQLSDSFKSTTLFSFVSENVDHSYQRLVIWGSPSMATRASYVYGPVYNGYTNIQQNFNGKLKTAGLTHNLLIGANYRHYNSSFLFADIQPVDQIDVTKPFKPIMSQQIDKLVSFEPFPSPTQQTASIYASDVINLSPRLSAMLSLRLDHYKRQAVEGEEGFKQTSFAPKFGLVYELMPKSLSLFANYMSGFQNVAPVSQPDGSRKVLDPLFANQAEAGIKTELFEKKLSFTASYYRINIDNATRTNQELFTIQDGKQLSKGLDLELISQPLPGLNILAGYAYNDNRIVRAALDAEIDGNKAGNAPENVANLWASYTFQNQLKGLGFGVGMNYVDKMYKDSGNKFFIPSYTLVNAVVFYNRQAWGIQLKANNIFNEKYWDSWANSQAPANLTANLSFRF